MKKIRLAATGDLHVHEKSEDLFKPAFRDLNEQADIFVLAGDLTATGKISQIEVLISELSPVQIPIVAVLGNHEFHNHKQIQIRQLLMKQGIHVLDGNCVRFEVNGLSIGFSGAKGFLAGFGKQAIPDFGEQSLKLLVDELYHEMHKMQRGLKRLDTDIKVLVMHYSPTKDTLRGEHPEIYAFLGSQVLGIPADDLDVDLIIHGHSHYGVEEGFTAGGTPVRNVCIPVLKKPYTIYELPFDTKREM